MSKYPRTTDLSSPALDELFRFLASKRDREVAEGSFQSFEAELHEKLSAVEREQLAEELVRYDVNAERIEIGGVEYRRKLEAERTYLSQAGEMRVNRTLYVPRGSSGRSICPLELRAGIVGRYWTPRAAGIAAIAVATMTPCECAQIFAEQGGMQPSTSSLDRLPKVLSGAWEKKRLHFEEELRTTEEVNELATALVVSLDGVQTPMKDGGRAEKRSQEGKRAMGPAGFREVACATLTLVDIHGERLETIRYARMPQEKKIDVKKWVQAEARSILEATPGLDVMFVADGAPDLWAFADELEEALGIEDMYKVLDAYHAFERMKKAFDAYHGEGSAESLGVFEEHRKRLKEDPGGLDGLLRALRYRRNRSRGERRKAIAQQIRYFENNRERMQYVEVRDRNLPIGSGIVEAACKTLVTQRLKRSGMSWSQEGGEAILTLRSLLQSNRWHRGWALLAAEFLKPVKSAA